MDERLAQIYGTGQTDAGEDLQKTAAAELLVKLAEQEGIDLDKCSDAQIEAMVAELFKTAEFPPPAADKKETKGEESSGVESKNESKDEKKESKESQEKEAQAKFAEADFLGRTMAHAMVQELDRIEKQAGKMGNLANLVRGKAGTAGKAIGEAAKKAGGAVASAAKKPGVTAGAGAAGGAAAGFLAGRAGKKKESSAEPSALDTMVQQRAYDLLKTAGYVEEDGSVKAPPAAEVPAAETQEKQASALDLVVTEQALKLLAAEGYPVNWGNKE